MIFAIAAQHAHLIQAPWQGDDKDHLVYLTRARILSMNGDVLFSHPDLQQVQVEGLIAFYLLSSDQINRYLNLRDQALCSFHTNNDLERGEFPRWRCDLPLLLAST
jgi:hypothetical protein